MSRHLPRTVVMGAIIAAVMALGAGPAAAQHPHHGFPNEPLVPAHQHYINGQRVGPNACVMGQSLGFDHFHINIHLGKPGSGVFRHDGAGLGMVTATGC
jgi:hypothetical protein